MINLKEYEIWFVTGSQHLYGPEVLDEIAAHSKEIAAFLGGSPYIPTRVICKPVMTTVEDITRLCQEANASEKCAGLVTWMHTFSPAKKWINGLKILQKPMAHLHTQYYREIPWADIDMDYMNLHQSAHGDREFGFVGARLRMNRKVVVGHWQDEAVQKELGIWSRAACAMADSQKGKLARFGDNMREVAVTEGNKVSAEITFGYNVYGYGIGDLVKVVNKVSDSEIDKLVKVYLDAYTVAADLMPSKEKHGSLREAARIEIGLRNFLEAGNFSAFTTTFEDLNGLSQLPGLACQRLMADGYGFGAEGDWKTAALLRSMKVMDAGLPGGTSFMEDYTYHFSASGNKILGAHMLEVCESIAAGKPRLEVLPLSIGGKADPARLIFDSKTGPAVAASLIDLGDHFRLIVNQVDVVPTEKPLPKLPVAHALWIPQPDLKRAAAAWIYAGGAHHTSFSFALTQDYLRDFADMAGIEYIAIDNSLDLNRFRQELRWNDLYYHLSKGL